MGRTGGGRGTNQYQVKGRSVRRPRHARQKADLPGALVGQDGRPVRRQNFDRETVTSHLTDLVERLSAAGAQAKIILIGGAALSFYYDRGQGTPDIDAALYPTDEVMSVAREIAEDDNLEPDWLNNAAIGFLPHQEISAGTIIQKGDVRVEIATAEVLLAMKLRACRQKDLPDLAFLLRRCDVRSVEEATEWLRRYYPEEEMSEPDKVIVKRALGATVLPTRPPTLLDAIEPRPPRTTCHLWVLKEDGHCCLPVGHGGPCSASSAT